MQTISKLFFTLIGLMLSLQPLSAQKGIRFHEGTWAEVLEAARTQQRIIFVDAYAEWCGPCKAMARNTFPDAEAGTYYNANFINYQFDMEKGEGIAFAEKYQVNAYPTLLYIDYRGEVVHQALGYRDPRQLIAAGKEALDPKNSMTTLRLKFESGSTDPDVLLSYGMKQHESGQDYREAATRYFATQSEKALLSDKNWQAITVFTQDLDSREFQYMLKQRKKYGKRYGADRVENKIAAVCRQHTIAAVMTRNDAKYKQALEVAGKYIADKGKTASRLEITYFGAKKDWAQYARKSVEHYSTYPVAPANELNTAAWNFYLHVDDPAQLEKAAEWARQSVALENAYYNNDTYASVLYKLGRYDEALKIANKAIGLARVSGQDAADTEKLVQKIRERMN